MKAYHPKVQLKVVFKHDRSGQSTWPVVNVHKPDCRNARGGRVVTLPESEPNIYDAIRAYEAAQRSRGGYLPGYHPAGCCYAAVQKHWWEGAYR